MAAGGGLEVAQFGQTSKILQMSLQATFNEIANVELTSEEHLCALVGRSSIGRLQQLFPSTNLPLTHFT